MNKLDRALLRKINGALGLVLVVFFLGHGVISTLAMNGVMKLPPSWIIWIGVALLVVHVLLGLMLTGLDHMARAKGATDVEIGPLLWVRWISGVLIAVCAFIHSGVFFQGPNGAFDLFGLQVPGVAVMAVFIAALAVHIIVNVRHALEDHVQHPVKSAPVVAIVGIAVVCLLVAGAFTVMYFA